MPLVLLRCVFLAVSAGLGLLLVQSGHVPLDPPWAPWSAVGGLMALAVTVMAVDVSLGHKRLDVISSVYFGLVVGLFLAYVAGLALSPLLVQLSVPVQPWANTVLAAVFCYTCISLLMQTRDDFRFIIPYVEFVKDTKGLKPYVLDTSAVIDGRIVDVVETRALDNPLVMPRFVIAELQAIADSSDRQRRTRGRRGLDMLNRLRDNPDVEVRIHDRDLPQLAGQPVDIKLILLAKHLGGKVVTSDYNLNKVAQLHDVDVVNLNDLANALKPAFAAGDLLDVKITKPGEGSGQGVGYLDDGTMIVIESGRDHVHEQARVAVTSVLQTSAGRMVFGRYEGPAASV